MGVVIYATNVQKAINKFFLFSYISDYNNEPNQKKKPIKNIPSNPETPTRTPPTHDHPSKNLTIFQKRMLKFSKMSIKIWSSKSQFYFRLFLIYFLVGVLGICGGWEIWGKGRYWGNYGIASSDFTVYLVIFI